MISPKTHVNKGNVLIKLLEWMKTFEGARQWDKQIMTCHEALKLFVNNAKLLIK